MKAILVSLVVLLIGIASSASATELKVVNKSKTALHHLYGSPASQKSWGQDQLGSGDNDTVEPGYRFSLHGIEPGTYDVKLVAEDKTECEVDGVEFDENKEWVVTGAILDKCAG